GREGYDFGVPVDHPPLKFIMLSGGVVMEIGELRKVLDTPFATPSMHMMGTLDTVIDIKGSRELASRFPDPVIYEFVGGHFLPNTPHCRRAMRAFLKPFIPVDEEPESN
ncbi:Family of serine hydrolases 3, partial [Linderina pennispora]